MIPFDQKKIDDFLGKIIIRAERAGATDVAVTYDAFRSNCARFSKNEIIQNIEQCDHSVTLAVAVGKHESAVSTNVTADKNIDDLVKQAVETALRYPENPEHVGCIPPFSYPSVNCFDEATENYSPMLKAEVIKDICSRAHRRKLFAFGTFKTGHRIAAVKNNRGVFAYHPETIAQFTITARTEDNLGSNREARSHHRVDAFDVMEISEKTMERAEKSLNPREIPPGDYTVILTPTAVLSYFAMFFWTLDARMIAEKRSALSSHFQTNQVLDKKLFSEHLSLYSRANHPEHPRQPFSQAASMEGFTGQSLAGSIFSRGLPVKEFPIIQNGVLKTVFPSRYWAKKNNIPDLAFPTLVEIPGSDETVEDLVKSTQKGLFINSLWYIRFVDPNHLLLTGLTRDGVFYIEDGEIAYPVKNLRFNESPLVSMGNIERIGKPERRSFWHLCALVPPMKINDFTFSATTDAI